MALILLKNVNQKWLATVYAVVVTGCSLGLIFFELLTEILCFFNEVPFKKSAFLVP